MPPLSPERSARLDLPYLMPAQAQKHVTHNDALALLDLLVQLVLTDVGRETPPEPPIEGEIYALGPDPSGDWAGQAGRLAVWQDGGWRFLAPHEGALAWDLGAQSLRVWQGGSWQSAEAGQRTTLGIATAADAQNPLAVAGPATLLTHAGGGHQLKINKAGSEETASLLFQSAWAGHAEMGLAGENGFSIKVSADGSNWLEALRIDPTSGHLQGAAIQASPGDTTPGRLMRADWGYGPGNLLGAVGFSADQPNGAVIEQGENGQGAWLRLADGTQICWAEVLSDAVWSFPQSFVNAPNLQLTLEGSLPRMLAADATSASQTTALSYDASGVAQAGDMLHALAVGRWH